MARDTDVVRTEPVGRDRCAQSRLRLHGLEVELRAQLPNTRITRRSHKSELAAAEVAVGIIELRMIEDVEEFNAQLERG